MLSSQISPKKVRLAESPLRKVCPLSLLLSPLSRLFSLLPPVLVLISFSDWTHAFLVMSVWCSSYIIVFRAKMHEPTDQTNDELWRCWSEMHVCSLIAGWKDECGARELIRFINLLWMLRYVIWLDMMNWIIRSETCHLMKYQSPSVGMNHNILCRSFYSACVDITNQMMKVWAHSWTDAIKIYSNAPQIGLIIYFRQK